MPEFDEMNGRMIYRSSLIVFIFNFKVVVLDLKLNSRHGLRCKVSLKMLDLLVGICQALEQFLQIFGQLV